MNQAQIFEHKREKKVLPSKERQVLILKKMTGQARLEQACYLSDLTRELAIINIRDELGKKASPELIYKKLQERLAKG